MFTVFKTVFFHEQCSLEKLVRRSGGRQHEAEQYAAPDSKPLHCEAPPECLMVSVRCNSRPPSCPVAARWGGGRCDSELPPPLFGGTEGRWGRGSSVPTATMATDERTACVRCVCVCVGGRWGEGLVLTATPVLIGRGHTSLWNPPVTCRPLSSSAAAQEVRNAPGRGLFLACAQQIKNKNTSVSVFKA